MQTSEYLLYKKWDIAIIGGGLSGSATAIELLRRNPSLRVILLESKPEQGDAAGETSSEVGSYFLSRVLGFSDELNRNHLTKQGLRFWFANRKTEALFDSSEIGPKRNAPMPSYQIDLATLSDYALEKASRMGASIVRGAKALSFDIKEGGLQTVLVDLEGERSGVNASWVIDATGSQSLLARDQDWLRLNEDHPIASISGRWSHATGWDDTELQAESPKWADRIQCIRNNATNHILGDGWIAQWIPLQNGDVSIHLVYDKRLFNPPSTDNVAQRFAGVLRSHPVGLKLLENAELIEESVSFSCNLSYYSDTFAGNGFAIVGDAAAYFDPLYSPGMDWMSFSVSATAKLVAEAFEKEDVPKRAIRRHNQLFRKSYDRWFKSIYRDMYYYVGDFELMKHAYRINQGLYCLESVTRLYLFGKDVLTIPAFAHFKSLITTSIMTYANRSLVSIGRKRADVGRFGRHNTSSFCRPPNYCPDWTLPIRLGYAITAFCWFESVEGLFNTGKKAAHVDSDAQSEAIATA